jgi:hypothetical protein
MGNHEDNGSCEYEMVRLALRGNEMVVVIQCKYHGTTFSVGGHPASQINEKGQLLIDEFDYENGRDLAAQGFDGQQRKADRESFDQTYAEHIAKNMTAITERLRADGYSALNREDGGKGTMKDAIRSAREIHEELGFNEVEKILGNPTQKVRGLVTKTTGVITVNYDRRSIGLSINGKDLGDIPLMAFVVDPGGVTRSVGEAMMGQMMQDTLDAVGITDATETMKALRTAAMLKKLEISELPLEMDWPEEQN